MATQDELKRSAAKAAIAHVPENAVIGVGTGSTVDFFIAELAAMKGRIEGAVSSSEGSSAKLKAAGIRVIDLNSVDEVAVYVDGADEIDARMRMIKGGGGALTREKIVAAVATRFVCIVDEKKLVGTLGRFPLPIEVLPIARSHVGRQVARMGGQPSLRAGFVTDNGNLILDVHGLKMHDPVALESELNQIAGVVCNGLFARRPADIALVASAGGVRTLAG
ncbi:MAG: ribose-5-phosphate isomerase RpiA [Rhodocyclaceae bacterium]|jgi:ribose 5-phosphate isomerase A|nr:ribose-5-phosphate isomerase RpiA [Rhodocyclaceae bacterium]MCE2980262.1 ribose-5-phosphate isomerase RpiA [Betaproteobacteria bacterium]MCA3073815.1 ribose-5-phosphate isomerase RpiA [Rhodocyclaceae bacterium]MCA3091798.1 ribose-5-phosphate isomerase RpiA [Rhodocyclaceae bacterium]MCA3093308.1 ribose-5-phosphate isomerase RpiA [Rhodocyclaceae bacterium]